MSMVKSVKTVADWQEIRDIHEWSWLLIPTAVFERNITILAVGKIFFSHM